MEMNDVYDALDDVKGELSAMAYETFAMARDAESEMGAHPLPLERGRMDALDALYKRLVQAAETIDTVNKTLTEASTPTRPLAIV